MPRGVKRSLGKDLDAATIMDIVGNMVAARVSVPQIAKTLDISEARLRSDFLEKVQSEEHRRNAKIVGKLYELCLAGDKQAIMFWCKTKLGWREKSEVEVSGNLASMQPVLNVTVNQITEKELRSIAAGDAPNKYIAISEAGDSTSDESD